MRKLLVWGFFPTVILIFSACKPDYPQQIAKLETALQKKYTAETADSLVNLYRSAVKAHPEARAANVAYLSKAAAIKFLDQNDATSAARWCDDAINNYGKGLPLIEPVEVLSRVWNAYTYKAAAANNMDPDDIDRMHANLLKNLNWMDSSLLRLDHQMNALTGGQIDKKKANAFIDISEAEAGLQQELNHTDRYVELTLTAAGLSKSMGNPNKAIQLYYNVEHYLPNHPKAPTALFMTGFIYENDLHNLEKAKAAYEDFLKRYPKDPDYADDAAEALKLLGKSAEELVREFEQKNK